MKELLLRIFGRKSSEKHAKHIHVVRMKERTSIDGFDPGDFLPDGSFSCIGFTSRYEYKADDAIIIPDWNLNGTRTRGIFRIESIKYYSDPNDQYCMKIRQILTKGELNKFGLSYEEYEKLAQKQSGRYTMTGDHT